MRGMILAAGRGGRMGALTYDTPKPLIKALGNYLIEYSIFSLIKAGVRDIVINVSYHGEQIQAALGDGSRYGVHFHYSVELEALETGGGILQALPLLGDEPFIVLSSDVVTDYPLQTLPTHLDHLAHLVVVDNPHFHPRGDFCLNKGKLYCAEQNPFTFANIGIYRPELFADCKPGKFRLGEVIRRAITKSAITGEHYSGIWHNVGTPDDLSKVLALTSSSAFR